MHASAGPPPTPFLGAVGISRHELEDIVRRAAESAPGVHHLEPLDHVPPLSSQKKEAAVGRPHRSVRARVAEGRVHIELSLYAQAGAELGDVVQTVQSAVRAAVHAATPLTVRTIRVRVKGFRRRVPASPGAVTPS